MEPDSQSQPLDKPTKPKRRRVRQLRVPVTDTEAREIEGLAQIAGMSVAAYLRTGAFGVTPRSIVDQKALIELMKVNGDLGRLGGLLKLWLSDSKKLAVMHPVKVHKTILGALDLIVKNQSALSTQIDRICIK